MTSADRPRCLGREAPSSEIIRPRWAPLLASFFRTFNRAHSVGQAIDSVLQQTHRELEVMSSTMAPFRRSLYHKPWQPERSLILRQPPATLAETCRGAYRCVRHPGASVLTAPLLGDQLVIGASALTLSGLETASGDIALSRPCALASLCRFGLPFGFPNQLEPKIALDLSDPAYLRQIRNFAGSPYAGQHLRGSISLQSANTV